LWVALLILFLWMYFPIAGPGDKFRDFEKKVHPYSGLDPESWKRFLSNMSTFKTLLRVPDVEGSAKALYGSLENIRDMAMGIRRADDSEIQDTLNGIANDLGYEGEFVINYIASQKGLQFFPKYLNERIDDKTNDGPAFIPKRVRSHGQ